MAMEENMDMMHEGDFDKTDKRRQEEKEPTHAE